MTLTAREFLARMKDKKYDPFDNVPRCAKCDQGLSESVTGNRHTSEGFVDSDCYFDMLSEVVEEHPIRTARIRRG